MLVQAAVEDLPAEFKHTASEIYINFPWGSLFHAVATGDAAILISLKDILLPGGTLAITIGVDPIRDKAEMERLGIPELSLAYIDSELRSAYASAGLKLIERGEISEYEWSRIETSWARKLAGNAGRRVFRLRFVRYQP